LHYHSISTSSTEDDTAIPIYCFDYPTSGAVLILSQRMRNSRRGNGAAIAAAAFTSAQSPIHARAPSATAVCLVVATFFLLLSTSRSALASSSAANGNGNGLATEQQQQQELEQTVKDDEPPDTDPTKKSPVEAPISAAAGLEQNQQQQYNGHQHIQLPSKVCYSYIQ